MQRRAIRSVFVAAVVAACTPSPSVPASSPVPAPREPYEVVILGGRVMDPESGLDAIRNVGIHGGKVRVITEGPINGRIRIDARGLVVAPGFIDLHQHTHTPEALRTKVLDGVTAAFEMETGVRDIDEWYAMVEGKSPIHFGASIGHPTVRTAVLTGSAPLLDLPGGEGATRLATPDEITAIRERVEQGLRRGALGVGLAVEYTPGATPWEVLETFRAAAAFPGAAVYVHVRGTELPYHWMETAELFLGALVTGAPLHIVHANSSYGSDALRLFEMIQAARARGLDVTTEAYPYTVAMTSIESEPFAHWESWAEDRFRRFIWPHAGERLTRESFGRYRAVGGLVLIEGMTEENLRPILASPLSMIVSDGELAVGAAHPRIAGTYARVLGR
ncbi:hypothetical protein BH23GEM8_BH23GEM8_03730 [soil metagenome]